MELSNVPSRRQRAGAYSSDDVNGLHEVILLELGRAGSRRRRGSILHLDIGRRCGRSGRRSACLAGLLARGGSSNSLDDLQAVALLRIGDEALGLLPELLQHLDGRLEHLVLERRVVTDELVDGGAQHVAIVALLEDTDMLLRSEDGEVARDERAGVELVEADGVEAEGADSVGNGLENVDGGGDGLLDGIVQRSGNLGLLNGRQASRLVVDEGGSDVDAYQSVERLDSVLSTVTTSRDSLRAKT